MVPHVMVPLVVLSALLPLQEPKFPIVVLPVLPTENRVVVDSPAEEEEMVNTSWLLLIGELESTNREKFAMGVVVPIPTLPEDLTTKRDVLVEEATFSKSVAAPLVP